jgi:putative hemolysin
MASLGRIPMAGDKIRWHGVYLEVVDMDGRRVDKVLATVG